MHMFVTGASGWVGSAVVDELVQAGHRVTGLVRSDEKAAVLAKAGAQPVMGTLDDLDLLRTASVAADAVVHTAFNHDFSRFAENAAQDRRAIETIGAALEGSDKALLVSSGVALIAPGRVATEQDRPPSESPFPRRSENTAQTLAGRGVRAATVRLAPSTHGIGDHGFVPILIELARRTGVSAYIGEGANRWPGVHRLDAARVYRLALESGTTEAVYHAIGEEGVPFREIALAIGRGLGVPVEARGPEHFDWFGAFAGMDMPASNDRTRAVLGWTPTGPGLLEDLDGPGYFGG
jgi:nucleoside-diphosphate-sugar epimerase